MECRACLGLSIMMFEEVYFINFVGGDSAEEPMDWRKCKMIARILSSCPKQAPSLEDYYSVVCPQVCRKGEKRLVMM